jgi:hypothetical protein
MFANISYKNKFYFLCGGFVIALFLVYHIALKSTFELKKQCSELTTRLSLVDNAPERIAGLENQISHLNTFLASGQQSVQSGKDLLLDAISRFCQKNMLVLREFPDEHVFVRNKFEISTSIVTVEGGFIKLLRLLYLLETNKSYGKISSADFYSYTDKKTKKNKLNLTIYVQTIRKTSE